MKVFLTGGTGYLGGAILAELVAHGHQVLAHARSDTAAAQLASMGIDPVTGDLADTGWLTGRLSGVEGMIHSASPNDATSASVDNAVLDAALPAFAGTDRPYVHTGGSWIHGSGSAITEAAPADPPPVVAWRPGVLDRVRGAADSGVRSCVVAPANLYGNAGGLPALIIAGPTTGGDSPALLYPGADQRFANVYTGDIAAMFRLALETAPPGSYYLAANADAPTMATVAARASRLRGLDGRAVPEPAEDTRSRLGPLTDPLLLDQQIDASHAHELGWHPTGPSLLDELAEASYAAGAHDHEGNPQ